MESYDIVREAAHRYLSFPLPAAVKSEDYVIRLLEARAVPCLLPGKLFMLNGETSLKLDITTREALSCVFKGREISFSDLKWMFSDFLKALCTLPEYLISPEELRLSLDLIFTDARREKLYFCCLPRELIKEKEASDRMPGTDTEYSFLSLMEEILPRLDHRDAQAMALGYGLYREALAGTIRADVIEEALMSAQDEEKLSLWRMEGGKNSMKRKQQEIWEDYPDKKEALYMAQGDPEETGVGKKAGGLARKILLPLLGSAAALLASLAVAFLLRHKGMETSAALLPVVLGAGGSAGLLVYLMLEMPDDRKKHRKSAWPSERKPEAEGWKDGLPEDYGNIRGSFLENSGQDDEEATRLSGHAAAREEEGEEETRLLRFTPRESAKLIPEREGLVPVTLSQNLTLVGKIGGRVDVLLPLPTVSRMHARIVFKDGAYYLGDLRSANGTYVNGKRLSAGEAVRLVPGDRVGFADAVYTFEEP